MQSQTPIHGKPGSNGSASRRGAPVRYAVVGLGWIAQSAILPAFVHARRNSKLAALISDDPLKLKKLGRRYGVRARVGYADFESCLADAEIDAVFIALPNHLHREYTERAARAGVHVLCEKPLATSVDDCRAMIAATRAAGVRLMTAYRLHLDPANLQAIHIASSGKLGELRCFDSIFSTPLSDAHNIRLDSRRGGGTLWDLGVYCINAARGLFRAEPEEVFARATSRDDALFRDVEEMTSAILRFPDQRVATFTASFGAADVSSLRVLGTRGSLTLSNAYEIKQAMQLDVRFDGKTRRRVFAKRDPFAAELSHFSQCVRSGREPAPSGEEGLADVRVIEALYRSIASGKPQRLEPELPVREVAAAPVSQPPTRERELVHVRNPSP